LYIEELFSKSKYCRHIELQHPAVIALANLVAKPCCFGRKKKRLTNYLYFGAEGLVTKLLKFNGIDVHYTSGIYISQFI